MILVTEKPAPQPEPTPEPTPEPGSPSTADSSWIFGYGFLAACSFIALCTLRKRQEA